MTCQGFSGAAWIAAYSTCILDLNVTAIVAKGRTHQIYYGPYEDARIIIDLSRSTSEDASDCRISINGNLQDFFRVDFDRDLSGWAIDCSIINLPESECPGIMACEVLSLISAYAAAKTMNEVAHLADIFARCCSLEDNCGRWIGFQS